VISVIRKEFKASKVRVVLGEGMAFVFSFAVKVEDVNNLEVIKQLIEVYVPDSVENLIWDYRVSDSFRLEKNVEELAVVQVTAIAKDVYGDIMKAFERNKVRVRMLEPVSISLARLLKDEVEPQVVMHIDRSSSLSVIYRGLVVVTELLDVEDWLSRLEFVLNYVDEHFGIQPKQCILSGNQSGMKVEKINELKMKVVAKDLSPDASVRGVRNPDSGLLKKRKKKSFLFLRLKMERKKKRRDFGSVEVSGDEEKERNLRKMVTVVGLLLLIISVLGYGGWYLYKSLNPEVDKGVSGGVGGEVERVGEEVVEQVGVEGGIEEASEEGELSPTSPEISLGVGDELLDVDLSKKSVRIGVLNGSGIVGAASEVEVVLVDDGYENTSIGNADNYDYSGLTILYKEGFERRVEQLVELFEGEYEVEMELSLELEGGDDIVVVVGS
jgi:hypothetical protein